MRLLLMIHSLGAGGAERVMTLIADALVSRGHEVHLLTLADVQEDFFSPVAEVKRVRLALASSSNSLAKAVCANIRRIVAIRGKMVELAPDAVVSFTTSVNVLALIAGARTGIPVFVSERVDPRAHALQRQWSILRDLTYRRARAIIVQTKAVADWYRERLPDGVEVATIPNPVAARTESAIPSLPVSGPYFLAMGRLVPQKGFDVLIRAFQLIAHDILANSLIIIGAGSEREALEGMVRERGLQSRVHVLDPVKDVTAVMDSAHAFVLSSRYEGFPNVLLEALAGGIPVIATDCPSGPREILDGGRYGLLVPPEDPEALATAMRRIATDAALRTQFSSAGTKRVEEYRPEVIVTEWEQILDGRKKPRRRMAPHSDN